MKRFLTNALAAFVGGAFLVGAVISFFFVYEWWSLNQPFEPDGEWIESPGDFVVISHSMLGDTQYLTITGVISNEGEKYWNNVTVEATIKVGNMQIESCTTNFYGFDVGVSRPFLIECSGLQGNERPENLSYVVTVRDGYTYDRPCDNSDT